MKSLLLIFVCCNFILMAFSQTVTPLYADSIPNSKPAKDEEQSEITNDSHILIISKVSRPTITAYLPGKPERNCGGDLSWRRLWCAGCQP